MTFGEMQAEIIRLRFAEIDRDSIKRWINLRYQWMNAQADWPWSRISIAHTLTSGSRTVTLSTSATHGAYKRVIRVTRASDPVGDLPFLPPEQLFSSEDYLLSNGGDATAYTVKTNVGALMLHFNLLAAGDTSYQVYGESRPLPLSATSDTPIFTENWHYLLVIGATATGLKMQNDPTWEALETEFLAGVESMKTEMLPPEQPEPRQFGRDLEMPWQ